MKDQHKEDITGQFVEEMTNITFLMTVKWAQLKRYATKMHIFSYTELFDLLEVKQYKHLISLSVSQW